MKLIAMEIPNSPDEIADWLEMIVCGGDLRNLVSELSAVSVSDGPSAELKQVLGSELPSVLEVGLPALQEETVRRLLSQPSLLLDLQELVMSEGGEHWQSKLRADVSVSTIERTRMSLEPLSSPKVDEDQKASLPSLSGKHFWNSKGSVLSAIAATIMLVAFGTYWIQSSVPAPSNIAWGWASENGVPVETDPQEYLRMLAKGADAWFKKTPTDHLSLKTRIEEFSAGCAQLVNAEHRPLNQEDRSWLREQCRGWQGQLEVLSASVSQRDFKKVKSMADEVAREISFSLLERAAA